MAINHYTAPPQCARLSTAQVVTMQRNGLAPAISDRMAENPLSL
jgi:hypothetical protein